jgi:hypothetical protein
MSVAVRAELSSITSTVLGLQQRLADLAHRQPAGAEDVIAALYEAERSMLSASRHLARAERCLG